MGKGIDRADLGGMRLFFLMPPPPVLLGGGWELARIRIGRSNMFQQLC